MSSSTPETDRVDPRAEAQAAPAGDAATATAAVEEEPEATRMTLPAGTPTPTPTPTRRVAPWRRVAARAGALLLYFAAWIATGGLLDALDGAPGVPAIPGPLWDGAVALVFAALMIRFSRAGFAFVAGAVALVTLLLPIVLLVSTALALEGDRAGASLAAYVADDPFGLAFARLMATLATIIAWPMLVRLLRPRTPA